jgi:hypothetical protein
MDSKNKSALGTHQMVFLEGSEFEDSLGFVERPCHEKTKNK